MSGARLGPSLAGLLALLALGACRVTLRFAGADSGGPPASGCTRDEDCPLPSLHCDPVTGSCFACVGDSDCSADAGLSRCDTAAHICVQCGLNVDCPEGWLCVYGNCVQSCVTSAGCSTAGTHCDDGICEQCDENRECPGAAPYCDLTTRQCVACISDGQCAAPAPRCNPTSGRCVACLVSSDCPGDSVCDPTAWSCEVPPG